MKILFIVIMISLTACANLSSQSDYPSVEQECEMSDDMQSAQCNILAQEVLTQNEKHHLLGYIYWTGVDVEADYAKAKYWFEDVAKQGNAQSINALGVMNFGGQGMQKNNKKAEEYYLLAEKKVMNKQKLI